MPKPIHDEAGHGHLACHPTEQSTPARTWLQTIALWIARHRRRKALEEMAQLNEHLLRDVGLSRAQILKEAARPFWAPSQPPSPRKETI
jgi:uncharacterized protein YjiS (DUF1127 family)